MPDHPFFADTLAAYHPEDGKSITRSVASLVDTLRNFAPHPCQISLDGRDLSGEYLNVEVLNTHSLGPRLKIAPDARTDDGLLDVVLIRPNDRDSLLDYISRLVSEDLKSLPGVQEHRGRRIDLLWEGDYPLHLDAEVRPQDFQVARGGVSGSPALLKASESLVTVETLPGALEFWLPYQEEDI